MHAISARNIHKSFGDVDVLKGIDIDIEAAEVVAIVGASGAGKTTLLQVLGTLERPDQGSVFIGGIDISKLNDKEVSRIRNRQIGFVFQFHQLLPEFTALENVCMPAFISGTSKKEALERATSLLSYLGLGNRVAHKPAELSGGEQQRVAVARALMNKPAIVLADEPSGNLDSQNARDLHELFFKLRKDFGQSFLIVTHNPDLAGMADRKLVMVDGGISP